MDMIILEDKYIEGCRVLDYGNVDKSEIIFLEILEYKEDYYPAINKLGVVQARRDNLEKAREYFEKALSFNEEYAPALVNLGNIYKESDDNITAEKYYLLAVQCDPDYYLAYYNLSVIYKERKDFDSYINYVKAYRKSYRKSIRRDIKERGLRYKNKLGFSPNIFILLIFIFIVIYMIL